jgi:hypothetical protein
VFQFFGHEINTASFAMYTFSASVLLQSLIVVTMSGAADHGRYRKKLLLIFAYVGSIATMLFLPVTPAVYLLGSLWAIVGNVCFGASFVLLNSFLPLLVRHHPSAANAAVETESANLEQVSQRISSLVAFTKLQLACIVPFTLGYEKMPFFYIYWSDVSPFLPVFRTRSSTMNTGSAILIIANSARRRAIISPTTRTRPISLIHRRRYFSQTSRRPHIQYLQLPHLQRCSFQPRSPRTALASAILLRSLYKSSRS